MSAYFRFLARCCTAGVANTVGGNINELARAFSLAEHSHATLARVSHEVAGPIARPG